MPGQVEDPEPRVGPIDPEITKRERPGSALRTFLRRGRIDARQPNKPSLPTMFDDGVDRVGRSASRGRLGPSEHFSNVNATDLVLRRVITDRMTVNARRRGLRLPEVNAERGRSDLPACVTRVDQSDVHWVQFRTSARGRQALPRLDERDRKTQSVLG
jgi:hypothetical protein